MTILMFRLGVDDIIADAPAHHTSRCTQVNFTLEDSVSPSLLLDEAHTPTVALVVESPGAGLHSPHIPLITLRQ
jgi:hypothetical protein